MASCMSVTLAIIGFKCFSNFIMSASSRDPICVYARAWLYELGEVEL